MKTNKFAQVLFALLISSTGLFAQSNSSESVFISGTKFTYPLIEKWIAEYAKVNPNSKLKIAPNWPPDKQLI